MDRQQLFVGFIILLTFYVFLSNPENLKSLTDAMSKPAGEFYGCKAFPFIIIFLIEAILLFALIANKKK